MPTNSMLEVWRELISQGGPQFRLVEHHALHLYFGVNESGKAVYFLKSEDQPRIPEFSSVVNVEQRIREQDGQWTLVFTLEDSTHLDPFLAVCNELTLRSSESSEPKESLRHFYDALRQWRSLFKMYRDSQLSIDQMRGLAAEMWFALHRLTLKYSPREVLDAWVGPFGTPQDFHFQNGEAYEVKSVQVGMGTVHISSVQQLEPDEFEALFLTVVTLDTLSEKGTSAWTLPMLATEFKSQFFEDDVALELLDSRFEALSFDPEFERYQDIYFSFSDTRNYLVSDGFPRIERSNVPIGISGVSYELSLFSIENFMVDLNQVSPE